MFSNQATKIDKIFTDDLTLCSKREINGEDFIDFCGLLRKHELYPALEKNPAYFTIHYIPPKSWLRKKYKPQVRRKLF